LKCRPSIDRFNALFLASDARSLVKLCLQVFLDRFHSGVLDCLFELSSIFFFAAIPKQNASNQMRVRCSYANAAVEWNSSNNSNSSTPNNSQSSINLRFAAPSFPDVLRFFVLFYSDDFHVQLHKCIEVVVAAHSRSDLNMTVCQVLQYNSLFCVDNASDNSLFRFQMTTGNLLLPPMPVARTVRAVALLPPSCFNNHHSNSDGSVNEQESFFKLGDGNPFSLIAGAHMQVCIFRAIFV
jgi:hypothetical protein